MPKSKLNILGLDPGVGPKFLRVGLATIKGDAIKRIETFKTSSVVGWPHEFGRHISQIVIDDKIDLVAWDSWGHRMVPGKDGRRNQLIVKNPIQQEDFRNWLMLWCIQNNVKCLAFRSSKAKRAYTDDDLYFMHNEAGNDHERDAIRHALFAQDILKGRVQ